MAVVNKEKVREIYEVLPKLNCGFCEFESCGQFTRAVTPLPKPLTEEMRELFQKVDDILDRKPESEQMKRSFSKKVNNPWCACSEAYTCPFLTMEIDLKFQPKLVRKLIL